MGFIEDIEANLEMINARIKHKNFKLVELEVGRYTQTRVVMAYIDQVADPEVVDKVKQRITDIEIDGIVDSNYIAQFLQDEKVKLFRQVGSDEKPDIIAAKILEGRVAIFVDGTPMVLTVPYIMFEDVQHADDYYSFSANVPLRRFLRIVGCVIAILGPGLYISAQLYHYNIVPINMLIIISDSALGSPFSPLLEVIFVLILFEVLYEASLHAPRHIGAVTGLLGALILGETAVRVGLISPPAVLVGALAIITMYIIPDLASQISLLRFVFCIVGGILGLYGLVIAGLILVVYLGSLDSYGAPYLAPYAPYIKEDAKDGIFKSGIREMKTRPQSIPNVNKTRAKVKHKKREVR
jgi:spore germination protein KA